MTKSVCSYILGQAQQSYHAADAVDHPMVLMQEIATAALADAGVNPSQVDAIGCIDPFSWTYADLAKRVAREIGCHEDVQEFWLPAGGTTPQDLLHTINGVMAKGELDVAVLFGAEAMRTRRKATRAGQQLSWPPRDKSVNPMRGQQPFTSDWEAAHGLRLPIQSYPVLENALRSAKGHSADQQIELAARLLRKNALVAADNPHAWFSDAPSVADIAVVSEENRMICYPYTKRMNAIMDVDQAAAIVIVSERYLSEHGGRNQAAAVLAGAGAEEVWNPIQRRTLSKCVGMEVAFNAALEQAGIACDQIDAFDFYSCFPVAVELALETLNIEPDDERPFTLTGGLAYAGGPGNNYVMHSLAKTLEHLRKHPDDLIMVTGVGMANTKHTATLFSNAARVPENATGKTQLRINTDDEPVPIAMKAEGPCTIASYTIEYDREGKPSNVVYILDTPNGERAIANSRQVTQDSAKVLAEDPVGKAGLLSWDSEENRQYFRLNG